MKNCCENKKIKIAVNETANFLKVISEANRLKILCILQTQDLCVCDIWIHLKLPQNLVSHHLKVLKDLKLVKSRKDGTKVIYSLNKKEIKKYYSNLTHYLNRK